MDFQTNFTHFWGSSMSLSAAIGDFNLDGRPDVVFANPQWGTVTVLLTGCR
jgi:hypothetical protein